MVGARVRSRAVVCSSRRRHTRYWRDWSSDVCSSDRVWIIAEFLHEDVAVCAVDVSNPTYGGVQSNFPDDPHVLELEDPGNRGRLDLRIAFRAEDYLVSPEEVTVSIERQRGIPVRIPSTANGITGIQLRDCPDSPLDRPVSDVGHGGIDMHTGRAVKDANDPAELDPCL